MGVCGCGGVCVWGGVCVVCVGVCVDVWGVGVWGCAGVCVKRSVSDS